MNARTTLASLLTATAIAAIPCLSLAASPTAPAAPNVAPSSSSAPARVADPSSSIGTAKRVPGTGENSTVSAAGSDPREPTAGTPKPKTAEEEADRNYRPDAK